MTADELKELFAPFAAVEVKRMFGGHGIYAEGVCFAIQTSGGEAFLKVDPETQPAFLKAGSSPFIYQAKGKARPTSFWRLPAAAYDEADELIRWAGLGVAAAKRAAAAKSKPKGRIKGTARARAR